jgi:hypothetical protein
MSQLMCGLHAVEKDDKLCDDGGGLGLVSSWAKAVGRRSWSFSAAFDVCRRPGGWPRSPERDRREAPVREFCTIMQDVLALTTTAKIGYGSTHLEGSWTKWNVACTTCRQIPPRLRCPGRDLSSHLLT